MRTKIILALVFVTLIVIFSLQNSELITVDFFLWQFSISTVLLILGCFILGLLVGLLISYKKKTEVIVNEELETNPIVEDEIKNI